MCNVNYKSFPDNFINAYINDSNEVIAVFHIPENHEVFRQFIDMLESNNNYIRYQEDIDEIELHFSIPEFYKADFELFLDGKYSKFSEEYKQHLIKYYGRKSWRDNYKVNPINVLYPEEFKRQQIANRLGVKIEDIDEVYDRPNLTNETYKSIEQLIQQLT